MTAKELVQSAWNEGLKPPPLTSVWEWADENRVLFGSTSEPGPYRTERTPYLRQIMDCLAPSSPTREIDLIKGTQVGCTEAAYNWIGFIIDQNPGNILCVLPDNATAKEWSQQRLSQLIEGTERLKGKIKASRSRDGGNSTYSKKFGACYLKMAWASSPKKMRSTPAPYIVADEVDAFARDSGKEGSPIELLRRRATNFPDSKFFRGSTPNVYPSLIETGFQEGDQRYYFVPCPHCRHFQRLVFSQLRWEPGDHESVRYICISCGGAIRERSKTEMLAAGIWIATRQGAYPGGDARNESQGLRDFGVPETQLATLAIRFAEMRVARHASFHLSALYSPIGWYSWASVAADWERAEGSRTSLKTFTNTVLGEVWREPSEAPDWKRLAERQEEYRKIPLQGLFVTAGVDVQKNRLEVQVRAWGERKESWLMDYVVLEGKTSEAAVWEKLTEFKGSSYEHESGINLPISMTGIDSGYETQQVYGWARKQGPTVIVVKGSDSGVVPVSTPRYVDVTSTGKVVKRGIAVRAVNVALLKAELYGWLNQDPPTKEELADGATYPAGYVHNNAQPDEFFQQLVAEHIVTRVVDYVESWEWVKHRERNEALDTFVYARAAAIVHGLDRAKRADFEKLRMQFPEKPVVTEQPAPATAVPPRSTLGPRQTRSRWLNNDN
jgi:phage terminase large subunit GpA-like protein